MYNMIFGDNINNIIIDEDINNEAHELSVSILDEAFNSSTKSYLYVKNCDSVFIDNMDTEPPITGTLSYIDTSYKSPDWNLKLSSSDYNYSNKVTYDKYNHILILGNNASVSFDYTDILNVLSTQFPKTENEGITITPYVSGIYFFLDLEDKSNTDKVTCTFTIGDNIITSNYFIPNRYNDISDISNQIALDPNYEYKLSISNNTTDTHIKINNIALGFVIGEIATSGGD